MAKTGIAQQLFKGIITNGYKCSMKVCSVLLLKEMVPSTWASHLSVGIQRSLTGISKNRTAPIVDRLLAFHTVLGPFFEPETKNYPYLLPILFLAILLTKCNCPELLAFLWHRLLLLAPPQNTDLFSIGKTMVSKPCGWTPVRSKTSYIGMFTICQKKLMWVRVTIIADSF